MQAQATPSPLAGLIEGRAITTTPESPVQQAIREQSDLGILMQGVINKPRQDYVVPASNVRLGDGGFHLSREHSPLDEIIMRPSAQVVRQLGDSLKLPEDATEAILRLSGAESATRFGMQAAVTKYAQDLEPESRIEYESHGGRILSDDKLWKAVTRLS